MTRTRLAPIAAIAFAIALTAGAPEKTVEQSLQAACFGVVNDDAELAEAVLTETMSGEALCACYTKSVMAEGEDSTNVHLKIMETVSALRREEGMGAEEAAGTIIDALIEAPESYPFTAEEFGHVGTYLGDVGDAFHTSPICESFESKSVESK